MYQTEDSICFFCHLDIIDAKFGHHSLFFKSIP
uniref:Uncharacterized protein n=1 Tax=Rhizophora mucronata TaxID=61149 RepID=A0A2P2NE72_RHIMU